MRRSPSMKVVLPAGLLLALLVAWLYGLARETVPQMPQSKVMVARSESLDTAIRPDLWPSGYPLLLFVARQLHCSPASVNLALFFLTIALVLVVSRRCFPNLSPYWLPLAYALCAFNYYNLAQFTSEALVVPLSLVVLLLLADYQRRRLFSTLACMSLCCALLFVSRYQAMLWLVPIVVFNVIFTARPPRTVALVHALGFALIAFAAVGADMAQTYRGTGHLTGMSRLGWDSRELPRGVQDYSGATGLRENLLLTLKTYFLDFVSPFDYGTHDANRLPHAFTLAEAGAVLLFGLSAGVLALTLIRWVRSRGSLVRALSEWRESSLMTLLAVEFLVGYLLVTLVVWTIGNNDPLYSRFLYPSYVYAMIVAFAGYALVKRASVSMTLRAPMLALFAYLLALNVNKLAFTTMLTR